MTEYNLKQVKADLDTIRTAAGISEVPTRHDAMGNALIALAGLIVAGWAMLSHGLWQIWGLGALVLPVGYLIGLRVRNRKASGGSPQIRKEFAAAGAVLSLSVPFVAYVIWAQRMKIAPLLVLATSIFFVGLIMLNGVIANPRHLELAPWCMALMAGALLIPSTSLSPVTVIGLMLTAGGFAAACVIGIQMRQGSPDDFSG